MFKLTRFTGEEFYLNPDLIKCVEDGGDTVVTLVTGERILVQESPEVVAKLFTEYKTHASPNWEVIGAHS